MSQAKGIIWLASYPKSGNTWTRIFLTNYLRNADQPANINQLEPIPMASLFSELSYFSGLQTSLFTPDEQDALRPNSYRLWAHSTRMDLLDSGLKISKVHDAYQVLPDGQALFPADVTRAAVYILRSPLDITVSFASHSHGSLDDTIARMSDPEDTLEVDAGDVPTQLRQRLGTWSNHVLSWVDQSGLNPHIMRYEDMYADPIGSFRKLVLHLFESVDETILEKAVRFSGFDELKKQETNDGFVERAAASPSFFRKGKIGDWRGQLNDQQVAQLIEAHGEVMTRFGYLSASGEPTF
jgi:hypothetical protein